MVITIDFEGLCFISQNCTQDELFEVYLKTWVLAHFFTRTAFFYALYFSAESGLVHTVMAIRRLPPKILCALVF